MMNKNLLLLMLAAMLTMIACKGKEQTQEVAMEEPVKMLTLNPAWETDTTLKTPESVFLR